MDKTNFAELITNWRWLISAIIAGVSALLVAVGAPGEIIAAWGVIVAWVSGHTTGVAYKLDPSPGTNAALEKELRNSEGRD